MNSSRCSQAVSVLVGANNKQCSGVLPSLKAVNRMNEGNGIGNYASFKFGSPPRRIISKSIVAFPCSAPMCINVLLFGPRVLISGITGSTFSRGVRSQN